MKTLLIIVGSLFFTLALAVEGGKKADSKKTKETPKSEISTTASDPKKEGEDFLKKNKKKKGVVTTVSGLQYEILTKGKGDKPKATDQVKVHYRGTLLNGTEFDSSYKRNEPATFPLNQVIKGWTEGVQLMNQGSKFKFYIPSELAYGDRGAGPVIPPNSTLIFEVELLEIIK